MSTCPMRLQQANICRLAGRMTVETLSLPGAKSLPAAAS
jgi:hypothetical protein